MALSGLLLLVGSAGVTVPAAAGASPSPGPAVSPPPGPYVEISDVALAPDLRTVTLSFTGAMEHPPDDPCHRDYQAWAQVIGDELQVAVVTVASDALAMVGTDGATRRGPRTACDGGGAFRTAILRLPRPYDGAIVRDLAGFVQFVRRPAGVAEIGPLPAGWTLRAEEDVAESPTGSWYQTWSDLGTSLGHASLGRLDLYQVFGAPSRVTGGSERATVNVAGEPGRLDREAADGELVLTWRLGPDGFSLVANEQDFPVDALVRLAETVRLPPP